MVQMEVKDEALEALKLWYTKIIEWLTQRARAGDCESRFVLARTKKMSLQEFLNHAIQTTVDGFEEED